VVPIDTAPKGATRENKADGVGFEPTRAFTLPVFKSPAACNSDRLGTTRVGSTELRRNGETISDDSRRPVFTDKRRTRALAAASRTRHRPGQRGKKPLHAYVAVLSAVQ